MRIVFPTEIAKAWDPKSPCDRAALEASTNLIESGLIDKVRPASRRIAHGVRAIIQEDSGIFDSAASLIVANLPGVMDRRPVLSLATSAMIMAYDRLGCEAGSTAAGIARQLLDAPKLTGTIPIAARLSAEQQILDRLGPAHARGRAAMARILLGVVSDSNRKPKIPYEEKQHSLDVIGQIASEHGMPHYEARARQLDGMLKLRNTQPFAQRHGSGLYFRR